jgi:hypothetical protein
MMMAVMKSGCGPPGVAQGIEAQLIEVMGIPRADRKCTHITHSSARLESIDPWVVNHC